MAVGRRTADTVAQVRYPAKGTPRMGDRDKRRHDRPERAAATLICEVALHRRSGRSVLERALPWPASGARQDDESLGRSGHRDVAVDRSFDALAKRLRVDQDDQVELEPLRQLRAQ